jgi:hypothetical protein
MPVGIVGGAAEHHDITLPALLDRDMDHPIVARLRENGDRGAGNLRTRPDWAQIRLHQAGAAERLVHGDDAECGHGANGVAIGALDVADDDGFHFKISSTAGNSR